MSDYNIKKQKVGTKTSSFGTPGRINHDSSKFYESRLYEGIIVNKNKKYIENEVPKENLNKIFCKSSESMDELPDNSIHLMITSPPYNVTKEYDKDLSLKEYLELLNHVWKETYQIGRASCRERV